MRSLWTVMFNISAARAFEWNMSVSTMKRSVEMVNQVRMKLLGAEIMVGLKKLDLPNVDLSTAKQMAQAALNAIQQGSLGYAIICAAKPEDLALK